MIFYHTLTILYIYCLVVQLFIVAGLFILLNTSIYLNLIIIFKFDFYLIFLLKFIFLPIVKLSIICVLNKKIVLRKRIRKKNDCIIFCLTEPIENK